MTAVCYWPWDYEGVQAGDKAATLVWPSNTKFTNEQAESRCNTREQSGFTEKRDHVAREAKRGCRGVQVPDSTPPRLSHTLLHPRAMGRVNITPIGSCTNSNIDTLELGELN